jgi:hypothetical protein
VALLRIRIELQRSSRGIEMPKLAELAREAQKFLKLVAEDVGLDVDGTWVAQDFYNQGIGFDAAFQASDIDTPDVSSYLHAVEQVVSVGPESNWYVPRVRPATLLQSARIARIADDDELVRIGFYNGDAPAVTWKPLHKSRAVALVEHFQELIEYRGMAQGVIHSLYKESQPPYFDLRDLASRELVKCFYQPSQYPDVHAALERKDAVVLVSGWIRVRRQDRQIREITIERIQSTKPLDRRQLEEFFGSAPGWTGDLSTEEFIDRVRSWNDATE